MWAQQVGSSDVSDTPWKRLSKVVRLCMLVCSLNYNIIDNGLFERHGVSFVERVCV